MRRDRPGLGSIQLPDIQRSTDDRVVAGVCAGIGEELGVDPMVVRLATVVLTLANGVGLIAYLIAWAVLPEAGTDPRHRQVRRQTSERAVALGLITLGVLLLVRGFGLVLPSGLVWSITVSAIGFSVVWARTSDAGRARLRDFALGATDEDGGETSRTTMLVVRAVLGGALLIVGLALLLASGGLLRIVGQLGLAVAATGVGVALLMGPWIVRLWRDLDTERRQRIRSEERSEMAAHLHDSVLQTLTLIQRHADAPQRARMLARRQERELRAWLYDERAPEESPTTLVAALEQVVTEVEDQHEVDVDLVLVGDATIDRPLEGFVSALREAANNAARHSGATEVSVYVEVEPDKVSAYVRDRGKGFDPAAVEPGRLGVSGSIIGRMQRLAGKAEVHSTPGEGTEVVLEIPRAKVPKVAPAVADGHPEAAP
jgi:signal transduction histidine kinase